MKTSFEAVSAILGPLIYNRESNLKMRTLLKASGRR